MKDLQITNKGSYRHRKKAIKLQSRWRPPPPHHYCAARERRADSGDVWHKLVIEVEHAEESLKAFNGSWRREILDGADFFGERRDAVAVHAVAEKVDGISAENSFGLLDDEAVFCEAFEKSV